MAVASNPKTLSTTLARLALCRSNWVTLPVAGNPNTDRETLSYLMAGVAPSTGLPTHIAFKAMDNWLERLPKY